MIVLDTHAWVWFIDDPERLSSASREAVAGARQSGEGLHVSCISTWEVHMLVAKGRLSMGVAPDIWVSRCEKLSFLNFQPVNNDIARLSVTACADMHGDPADRLIAATALYLGAPVVTRDAKIRNSGIVPCIW